jgi:hypothetical protein
MKKPEPKNLVTLSLLLKENVSVGYVAEYITTVYDSTEPVIFSHFSLQ